MTVIGHLAVHKPTIEVWLDRFSRHVNRRLYAGFQSNQETLIEWLAYSSKSAVPRRRLADTELADSTVWKLKNRLTAVGLDVPLLETYRDQSEYFCGLYDGQSSGDEQRFAKEAAAFFLDVLRAVVTQRQDDDAKSTTATRTADKSSHTCSMNAASFLPGGAKNGITSFARSADSIFSRSAELWGKASRRPITLLHLPVCLMK